MLRESETAGMKWSHAFLENSPTSGLLMIFGGRY